MTHVFAPEKECWPMSSRSYLGSPSKKMHPAPTCLGMWQSWQLDTTPSGVLPPKRRSAKDTPIDANVDAAHSE
jgi:hypothetical protein